MTSLRRSIRSYCKQIKLHHGYFVYGTSADGLHREFKKDRRFYSRNILWDDGVVREMGNLDRSFILFRTARMTQALSAAPMKQK